MGVDVVGAMNFLGRISGSVRNVLETGVVFQVQILVRVLDATGQVVGHDSVQAGVIVGDQRVGVVDDQRRLEEARPVRRYQLAIFGL